MPGSAPGSDQAPRCGERPSTWHSVYDSLYEEFKHPEYAPPPLKRVVGSERLGKKSGRGFHKYG